MSPPRILLALVPALVLQGCYTTATYSRDMDAGPGPAPRAWYRDGTVESVREIVQRTEGNPAGGAVVGGIVGGLLGHALTGGDGAGAFVGAIGGAATGAAVSQGAAEDRRYEVLVRFDDGSLGRISYYSPPPWRAGDRVRQTSRGLQTLGQAPARSPYPRTPRPAAPPPPPPSSPPPPPAQQDFDEP